MIYFGGIHNKQYYWKYYVSMYILFEMIVVEKTFLRVFIYLEVFFIDSSFVLDYRLIPCYLLDFKLS